MISNSSKHAKKHFVTDSVQDTAVSPQKFSTKYITYTVQKINNANITRYNIKK